MKTNEAKMIAMLSQAGIKFDTSWEMKDDLLTLKRLANKHRKLAEMDCNGEGVIRGKFYSWDSSRHAMSPAISDDLSVFNVASDAVEAKIMGICKRLGLRVEFQGDPRGYTVKVYKGDRFLDIQG